MRQVLLQVPEGSGDALTGQAEEFGAATLSRFAGTNGRGDPVDLLVVAVPNASVGPLVDAAQELGAVEAVVPSVGVYAFEPPAGEPSEELIDVTPTSPYEVVLSGQQSAGSWRGFLTYAAVAGVVAWLGLFTETMYLLTASMLIAPFAGPAMNTAISVVSGRPALLRHSVLRYGAGILVTAAISAGLTVVVGQNVVTDLMTSVLTITFVSFLLPLVAGAAGATFLVQAEHSSLISGAAVGILVAASLAPPAGGLGMALALGRMDLAAHASFIVLLQLTGITAAAISTFWLYGLRPRGQRFGADRPGVLIAGLGLSVAFTAGLLVLQIATAPFLTQGSAERDAAEIVAAALDEQQEVAMLNVVPQLSASDLPGGPRVVVEVRVERTNGAPPVDELRRQLEEELSQRLRERQPSVDHHVTVTAFDPPPGSPIWPAG